MVVYLRAKWGRTYRKVTKDIPLKMCISHPHAAKHLLIIILSIDSDVADWTIAPYSWRAMNRPQNSGVTVNYTSITIAFQVIQFQKKKKEVKKKKICVYRMPYNNNKSFRGERHARWSLQQQQATLSVFSCSRTPINTGVYGGVRLYV